MPRVEHPATVRTGEHRAQQLLLRTLPGECGELESDAAIGRVAFEASGLWKSATDSFAETGRPGDQPQTGESIDERHGTSDDLSQETNEPTGSWPSNISVSAGRPGNMRSKSSLVQRYHLCSDGGRLSVFGGSDGLVEPLCAGLGTVQQYGQRVLCESVADSSSTGREGSAHFQYRSGSSVHQRSVCRCSGVGGNRCEHGWPRSMDRQPIHRTAMAQCKTGRHLSAGLRRWVKCATRVESMVLRIQSGTTSSIVGLRNAGAVVSRSGNLRSKACELAMGQRILNRPVVEPSGRPSGLPPGSTTEPQAVSIIEKKEHRNDGKTTAAILGNR